MEKKKKVLKYVVLYVIMALLGFATYYFTLPALNVQSVDFWIFAAWIALLCIAPYYLANSDAAKTVGQYATGKLGNKAKKQKDEAPTPDEKKKRKLPPLLLIPILPILIMVIGNIASLELFNANAYASVIDVTEAEFVSDMPQTDKVTHIALMDTDTAKIIGNRTLGSLSHVVSQYEVSEDYSQINYMGTPKKVSNLEYAGFFKWIGNRASGIPGYVLVDPVGNKAKYVELEQPLR